METRSVRDGTRWWPESLAEHHPPPRRRDDWSYVLLEETVDDEAVLCRWPWPLADQRGRLFWLQDDHDKVLNVVVSITLLRTLVYRPDLQRRPRPGDTFAVTGSDRGWRAAHRGSPITAAAQMKALFPGRVLDVSADARYAAKLAYLGSAVTVYDEGRDIDSWEADQLRLQKDQRSPAPALSLTRTKHTDPAPYEDLA